MYQHDHALLRSIESFDIDGQPAALSFERRLARECAWSTTYAARVVGEYRRFLYLAMTAGHMVTPSDEVDQAWHLHMVYTESYWKRLCGGVLPRPLHHNPTTGGAAEDAKYAGGYERTLASYRAAFGEEPPADIWPATEARFDPARGFIRVREVDHWVVPKRSMRRWAKRSAALVSIVAAAMLTAGAAATEREWLTSPLGMLGAIVVLVIVIVIAAAHGASQRGRRDERNGSDSGCGGGCGGGAGGHHPHSGHDAGHHATHSGPAGTAGEGGSWGADGTDGSGGGDGGSSGCGSSGCGGGGCGGD